MEFMEGMELVLSFGADEHRRAAKPPGPRAAAVDRTVA